VDTLSSPIANINTLEQGLSNLASQLPASTVQSVQNGLRGLAEGLPVLMRVLDDCAKIHPFIAGEHSLSPFVSFTVLSKSLILINNGSCGIGISGSLHTGNEEER
jgi:hypothetical protein